MEDSTGKTIAVGDQVRWRGAGPYTIMKFIPNAGRGGCAGIEFEEPRHSPHQDELPDEFSVDKI